MQVGLCAFSQRGRGGWQASQAQRRDRKVLAGQIGVFEAEEAEHCRSNIQHIGAEELGITPDGRPRAEENAGVSAPAGGNDEHKRVAPGDLRQPADQAVEESPSRPDGVDIGGFDPILGGSAHLAENPLKDERRLRIALVHYPDGAALNGRGARHSHRKSGQMRGLTLVNRNQIGNEALDHAGCDLAWVDTA